MQEIYKDIKGYEGLYQVSNLGNVKSLSRNKILISDKYTNNATTYHRITLCKNGVTKRFLVHRLVATVFINNPENKPQVNHIDNNGSNNIYTNLEWVTASENMQHSVKQGRQIKCQTAATKAAITPNYIRYTKIYTDKLGERFIAYYATKNVITLRGKPRAAVKYLCKTCGTERIAATSWKELTIHDGQCPNCSLHIEVLDEDIV